MSRPSRGLGRLETSKDTLQVIVESGATHAGRVAVIVAGAVRDVTRELGEWATDVFEITDAARRARIDVHADPDDIAPGLEPGDPSRMKLEP